jgi:hypothetical protein
MFYSREETTSTRVGGGQDHVYGSPTPVAASDLRASSRPADRSTSLPRKLAGEDGGASLRRASRIEASSPVVQAQAWEWRRVLLPVSRCIESRMGELEEGAGLAPPPEWTGRHPRPPSEGMTDIRAPPSPERTAGNRAPPLKRTVGSCAHRHRRGRLASARAASGNSSCGSPG